VPASRGQPWPVMTNVPSAPNVAAKNPYVSGIDGKAGAAGVVD
jgi:hypothetical protein